MAHLHCQRYVKNRFRVGCIVIWRYWNTLKYPILVHFEQLTCNNACFVIIVTHCSGSFLQKYLPVIVQCSLGNKMFWNYFHGWNTQQRLAVPALLFYLPWYLSHLKYCPIGTVSQDRKLTHDKNITGKFYKGNGTTGYCLQDMVFPWHFLTKYNKNNVLE